MPLLGWQLRSDTLSGVFFPLCFSVVHDDMFNCVCGCACVQDVRTVINFDLPASAASYIHRVGRTGRAGKAGAALTLTCKGQEAESAALQVPRVKMHCFVHGFDCVALAGGPNCGLAPSRVSAWLRSVVCPCSHGRALIYTETVPFRG